MAQTSPYQPVTGFTIKNVDGTSQDLGNRYVTEAYLMDVYPNLLPGRTSPGLWAWGSNANGQLGLNNRTYYSSPMQVGSLTNWKQVSAGGDNVGTTGFTAAIKNNGTLWTWGTAVNGQSGLGNRTYYSSPMQVGSLTNWKQVSCGSTHVLAVKTDGTLWAWGGGLHGQLGNNARVGYSSPLQIGSLTNWKQVSAGYLASYAVKTDGTLWAWGNNQYGQLGLNNRTYYSSPVQVGALTNWKQISANGAISWIAAIKNDGTLWSWGDNTYGQLGNGNSQTYYSSPVQVGSLTDWRKVNIGPATGSAIKNDGTLWVWGRGTSGEMGNGALSNYSSPIQLGSLTYWKDSFVGGNFISAITTSGQLWAWGDNTYGQLGVGSVTGSSVPIQVGSLTNWKNGSAGVGYNVLISDIGLA